MKSGVIIPYYVCKNTEGVFSYTPVLFFSVSKWDIIDFYSHAKKKKKASYFVTLKYCVQGLKNAFQIDPVTNLNKQWIPLWCPFFLIRWMTRPRILQNLKMVCSYAKVKKKKIDSQLCKDLFTCNTKLFIKTSPSTTTETIFSPLTLEWERMSDKNQTRRTNSQTKASKSMSWINSYFVVATSLAPANVQRKHRWKSLLWRYSSTLDSLSLLNGWSDRLMHLLTAFWRTYIQIKASDTQTHTWTCA